MSSIDRRVVSIEMDDAQFQRASKNTMATLDKLEESMQFKNAGTGFDDIQRSLNNINFDALNSALNKVNDGFSFLGVMAKRTIEDITDSIYGFVKSGVTGLWNKTIGQIQSGGWRRANNIASAAHMLKGLGYEMADVEDSINYAVQDTAYGYDEASRIASQFLASGVATGEAMNTALRAVSGAAGMTGASFMEMGDIFAKVAGQGKVMAIDLNRFAVRGLNAAATLAEYFGTDEATIREMVHDGEVGFYDLAEAMDGAFGEHAKAANETYAGSLDNINAALSRIGAQFAAPYMEAMTPFFNNLRIMVKGIEKTMKPISAAIVPIFSSIWGEEGVLSRITDTATRRIFARWISDKDLKSMEYTEEEIAAIREQVGEQQDFPLQTAIESIIEKITAFLEEFDVDGFFDKLESAASWVREFIDPFITYFKEFKSWFDSIKETAKGFFDGFFTPITDRLKNFFSFPMPSWAQDTADTIGGVVENLEELLGIHREDVDAIIRGDYGNGQDRIKNLVAANKNYWDLQDLVNYVLNGTTTSLHDLSDEELLNLGYTQDQIDAMRQLYPEVEKTSSALADLAEIASYVIRGDFGNGADRYNALTEAGKNYWEIQDKVNEMMGVDMEKLHNLSDEQLLNLGYTQEQIDAMRALYAAMEEQEMEDRFGDLWLIIKTLRDGVVFLLDTWETFKQALADAGIGETFFRIKNIIFDIITPFAEALDYIFSSADQSTLYDFFVTVLSFINRILGMIDRGLSSIGFPLSFVLKGIIDLIGTIFKCVLNLFNFIGSDDGLGLFNVFESIFYSITNAITGIMYTILNIVTWLNDQLEYLFNNSPIIQLIGGALSGVGGWLSSIFSVPEEEKVDIVFHSAAMDASNVRGGSNLLGDWVETREKSAMYYGFPEKITRFFGGGYHWDNDLQTYVKDEGTFILDTINGIHTAFWSAMTSIHEGFRKFFGYNENWEPIEVFEEGQIPLGRQFLDIITDLPNKFREFWGYNEKWEPIEFTKEDQIPLGRQLLDLFDRIGAWWTKFNDGFKTVNEETGEKQGGFLYTLFSKLVEFAGFIGRAGLGVIDFIGGLFKTIGESAGFQSFVATLGGFFQMIGGVAASVWDHIYTLFFGKKNADGTGVVGAVEGIKGVDFAAIGTLVGDKLGSAFGWLAEKLELVKTKFQEFKKWLDDVGITDAVKKFFGDLWEALGELNPFKKDSKFTKEGIPIVPSFPNKDNKILNFFNAVRDRIDDIRERFEGFKEWLDKKGITGRLTKFFDDVGDIFNRLNPFKTKEQKAAQELKDQIQLYDEFGNPTTGNGIIDFFNRIIAKFEEFKSWLDDKGILSKAKKFFDDIADLIDRINPFKTKAEREQEALFSQIQLYDMNGNPTTGNGILDFLLKVKDKWDKFVEFVRSVKKDIEEAGLFEFFKETVIKEWFGGAVESIWNWVSGLFTKDGGMQGLLDNASGKGGILGGIFGAIQTFFTNIFSQNGEGMMQGNGGGFLDKVKNNPIVKDLMGLWEAIVNIATSMADPIRNALGALGNAIGESMAGIFTIPITEEEGGGYRIKSLSELFAPILNLFGIGKEKDDTVGNIEGAAEKAEESGGVLSGAVSAINGFIENIFGIDSTFPSQEEGGPSGLLGFIRNIEHFIAEILDNPDTARILDAAKAGVITLMWFAIARIVNGLGSIVVGAKRLLKVKLFNTFSLFAMNNLFKLILAILVFMGAALVIGNLPADQIVNLVKGLIIAFGAMALLFVIVSKYANSIKGTPLIDALKQFALLLTAMIPFAIGLFLIINVIKWIKSDENATKAFKTFAWFVGGFFALMIALSLGFALLKKKKGLDIGEQLTMIAGSMELMSKALLEIAKTVAVFSIIAYVVGLLSKQKIKTGNKEVSVIEAGLSTIVQILFHIVVTIAALALVFWAFNKYGGMDAEAFGKIAGVLKGLAIIITTLAILAGAIGYFVSKGIDFGQGLKVLAAIAGLVAGIVFVMALIMTVLNGGNFLGLGSGSNGPMGVGTKILAIVAVVIALIGVVNIVRTLTASGGKIGNGELKALGIIAGIILGLGVIIGVIANVPSPNIWAAVAILGLLIGLVAVIGYFVTEWKKLSLARDFVEGGLFNSVNDAIDGINSIGDGLVSAVDGFSNKSGEAARKFNESVDEFNNTYGSKKIEGNSGGILNWLGELVFGYDTSAAELDASSQAVIESMSEVPRYTSEEFTPNTASAVEEAQAAMDGFNDISVDIPDMTSGLEGLDGTLGSLSGNLEGYATSAQGFLGAFLGDGGINQALSALGLDGEVGSKVNGLLNKLETFNLSEELNNLDFGKIFTGMNLSGALTTAFGTITSSPEGLVASATTMFSSVISGSIGPALDAAMGDKAVEGTVTDKFAALGQMAIDGITNNEDLNKKIKSLGPDMFKQAFGEDAVVNEEGKLNLSDSLSKLLRDVIAKTLNLDNDVTLQTIIDDFGHAMGAALSESFVNWFTNLSLVKFITDIPKAFAAMPDLMKAIFTGEGMDQAYEDHWNSDLDIAYVTETAKDYALVHGLSAADEETYVNAVKAIIAAGENDIDTALNTAWENFGKNTMEGFSNGMSDNESLATDAATKAAKDVNDAGYNELQLGSPSKLWMRYGGWLIDGLVKPFSLNSRAVQVTSAVTSIFKKMNMAALSNKQLFALTGTALVNALIVPFSSSANFQTGQRAAINLLNGFTSQNQNAYNAGTAFINMVAFGITNGVNVLRNAATFAANQMVQAFVNARDAAMYANGIQNGEIMPASGLQSLNTDAIQGIFPKADYSSTLATITSNITNDALARKNESTKMYDDSAVVGAIGDLKTEMQGLKGAMSSMGVYIDGNVLAGEIAPNINSRLGYMQTRQRRGSLNG